MIFQFRFYEWRVVLEATVKSTCKSFYYSFCDYIKSDETVEKEQSKQQQHTIAMQTTENK